MAVLIDAASAESILPATGRSSNVSATVRGRSRGAGTKTKRSETIQAIPDLLSTEPIVFFRGLGRRRIKMLLAHANGVRAALSACSNGLADPRFHRMARRARRCASHRAAIERCMHLLVLHRIRAGESARQGAAGTTSCPDSLSARRRSPGKDTRNRSRFPGASRKWRGRRDSNPRPLP